MPHSSGQTIAAWSPAQTPMRAWPSLMRADSAMSSPSFMCTPPRSRSPQATGAGLTRISVRTLDDCLSAPGLQLPAVKRSKHDGDYRIYFSTDIGPTVAAIINHIQGRDDTLVDLRVERPSLEERVLEITGAGRPDGLDGR